MPLIKYLCSNKECNKAFSVYVKKAEEALPIHKCKFCSAEAKRTLSAPTSSSKITVDNGLQPRAIEIDPNIRELREDWTKPPNRGD
jgi:hypothetical protein